MSYAAHYERRRRIGDRQRAQLAELVAEGYSVSAAARVMGVAQQRGSQLWAQVRADLGDQAT